VYEIGFIFLKTVLYTLLCVGVVSLSLNLIWVYLYIKKIMSEEMRKQIDKIKNFGKFLNEDNKWKDVSFNHGNCDLYAVALHRLYNLPLYSVRNYYPDGSYQPNDKNYDLYGVDTEDAHIVVKLPNGNYLDGDGEMSEEQLIKLSIFGNNIGEIKLVPIDENEALSIFGGCDFEMDNKIDDINSIMRYVKKYKPLK